MHKGKKEKKRRLNITWIKLHEFFSFAIEYNPSLFNNHLLRFNRTHPLLLPNWKFTTSGGK